MEVLRTFRENYPDAVIIMITGFSTVETAVEAMKMERTITSPSPSRPMRFPSLSRRPSIRGTSSLRMFTCVRNFRRSMGSRISWARKKGCRHLPDHLQVAMTDSTVLILDRVAPAKNSSPVPSTLTARGERNPLFPSTVLSSRRTSWRVNCSDTSGVPLPVR